MCRNFSNKSFAVNLSAWPIISKKFHNLYSKGKVWYHSTICITVILQKYKALFIYVSGIVPNVQVSEHFTNILQESWMKVNSPYFPVIKITTFQYDHAFQIGKSCGRSNPENQEIFELNSTSASFSASTSPKFQISLPLSCLIDMD